MDCGPPGSSVHEILRARILEWVAISFSYIYIYIYICKYVYGVQIRTNLTTLRLKKKEMCANY